MFDSRGELGSAAGVAAAVADCHRALIDTETRLLNLAARWADCHPGDVVEPGGVPGRPDGRRLGGPGTPLVACFCVAELGALLETTSVSAEYLIADVLDLRHRLPQLWARVQAGQVRTGKARKVAQATRHLECAAAGEVDQEVAPAITSLPWTRFEILLEAAVLRADPEGAEARARQAEAERFVRAGRHSEHGLRLLVARAGAGDVTWFLAMANRIADILRAEGDGDTADVRRSKAIGILAQPARALQLLLAHQHDQASAAAGDEPESTDGTEEDGGTPPTAEGADHQSVALLPLPVDPDRCRPRALVYVHLSEEAVRAGAGVARVENIGPVLLSQLRRLLGHSCRVALRPVLDLADCRPVDAYEAPRSLREVVHLRNPADVFPWGSNLSRGQDLDHTIPYLAPDRGGPPGQTWVGNLGPLARFHHRVRTHGRWRLRQPEPGTYVWRSPHGWIYLVNASGTHPLGNSAFATAVWQTSAPGGYSLAS